MIRVVINSMEMSSSSEAFSCLGSRQITLILWHLQFHHHV